MAGGADEQAGPSIRARLTAVVWGREGPRVRATYRVLLAWPVLWLLLGYASIMAAGLVLPPDSPLALAMPMTGLLQAAFVLGALAVWARYLDRRPLSDYGTVLNGSWAVDAIAGFIAVLAGAAVWLGLGSAMGWATVEVAPGTPNGSLVLGLLGVFVGVAVNVWVQETVFWSVALKNGAEGLATRGLDPSRAVMVAWAVATGLYIVMHGPTEVGQTLRFFVALGVYGLLYVHTGNVALSIGVHTGVNYAGRTLFADPGFAAEGPSIAQASTSLGGVVGFLSAGAVPHIWIAYGLLLGYIRWQYGEVGIVTALAEWTPRPEAAAR